MSLSHVPSSRSPLDTRAASRDFWPADTLARWQGQSLPEPAAVWWPEDDSQVEDVLREASARQIAVVPFGAGSGVCGAARGRAGSWVVDLKRFDHIGPVDPATWTVEVGAGVNGQRLEDALAAQGFTVGHSPSSIGCSTVGGWLAARGAGQFSSRYGVAEDLVLGVDAVSPGRGRFTIGVPGASSSTLRLGEDELDVLLGSEGTLAVITRARLRVRPVAAARWLRGYRMPDVATALDAMRELMQGELWPAVVRLYDPVDTLIGGKTKPSHGAPHDDAGGHKSFLASWLAAVDELDAVRRRSLALPLSLPRLLRGLTDRLASGCLLIVGWEGDPEVVAAGSEAGHALLLRHGEDLGADPGERWFHSRHNVSYKLMPVFERGGFADTMEIAARWSVLPHAYRAVRDAVSPHAFVMAHFSHVYPEGGSIYFSFAGRGDRAVYEATWRAALDAVLASGATTTHHHGVGVLKAAHAAAEAGAAVVGWRDAKAVSDPAGVLNPERLFVGSDVVKASVPPLALGAHDGLLHTTPGPQPAAVIERALWPWASLPALPRAQRSAWQCGWVDVRGTLGGVPVALGRGPRSATGPDLRRTVVARGVDVSCTVGAAPAGLRWCGRAVVPRPWAVVHALLRADLRPSVVGTDADGALLVGFRGPAAPRYGAIARVLVPDLTPVSFTAIPIPSGPLVPCDVDDPRAVWATSERVFRPAEDSDA